MQQASQIQSEQGSDLDIMVVLGENASSGAPSLQECLDYANQYGADPSKVFIDHGGAFGAWNQTFTNIYTYSGGSLGLPWMAVFRGSNLEYIASDNALQEYSSVQDAVTQLLAE